MHVRWVNGRLLRRKKRVNSRSNEMVVSQRQVPRADNPGNVEWQDLSHCYDFFISCYPRAYEFTFQIRLPRIATGPAGPFAQRTPPRGF